MPSNHTKHDVVETHIVARTSPDERTEGEEDVILNDIATPLNAREDATTAGVLHSRDTQADLTGSCGEWSVDVGVDVVGSCGHKIGEVVDIRDDYVIVEKGFFMPEDVFVPKTAIADVDHHHLTLNVTKSTVDHSHWDEDPEESRPDNTDSRT